MQIYSSNTTTVIYIFILYGVAQLLNANKNLYSMS